ncbi:cryptochrome/photolyase family protein [Aurantimonas sp. MSK8Z-1]|uniref:cryptochrome/photolyase family protein n=1 Tax=Mangrovibrevibacter kandeliae TaxID=2968473 RepID=UPI002118F63E|nr:cryptochrome/photolyase family protein [Aurantimonas sp. MSK8Z-1]MCW4114454.1 cryptochrome/photolyase family protein [Aurantimonas sp. MSK8Z-1]
MTVLRFVLGDQLSRSVSSLRDVAPDDVILLAEVGEETGYVRHHKRKIAFLFAAMRHFAEDLRQEGLRVEYRTLDEDAPADSFTAALMEAVQRHRPERVVVTEPGEWRVRQMMEGWERALGLPVEIRPDDRFLCDHATFEAWAEGLKGLRMEYFYREMRRRTGFLMDGEAPVGGRWNFDFANRERLPAEIEPPPRPDFPPDAETQAVLDLVARRFGNHFGDLDGFDYPVTRHDALRYLDWFVEDALPRFGPYQDAMRQGAPLLFHSHLSALINCGLLGPQECCLRADDAYHAGAAPIEAVEGFIRQIIGWREFVRGIYWREMPGYGERNALGATRPLPDFFWTGETEMNCLAQAIGETKRNAYAHHIQRLMVLGNFCLLAGLDPTAVQEWYLVVYHDAYEWVEMPNVVGMILFADGGLFASKPYAASGNYIHKMSDYCENCVFDVTRKLGPRACPFNYLYWDFLDRNGKTLRGNQRLRQPYQTLDRMSGERRTAIRDDARRFLDRLPSGGDY